MAAQVVIYLMTFCLAPLGVSFFADVGSIVYEMAVSGMRIYGLGFLFAGINIFSAVRMMAYGKGHVSGLITFLRSFALLLLFLILLPQYLGLKGIWLAVPAAELLTAGVALWAFLCLPKREPKRKEKIKFSCNKMRFFLH